jgi:thiol:disulfide interchange protein DsbC
MSKIANKKPKRIPTIVAILVLLLSGNSAYAFDVKGKGCGTDCIECHKIKEEEASNLFKGFVDKVIKVEEGPVKGMWEVEVEAQGKRFPLYLHYSKKYFFAGNIIDMENRKIVGKPARDVQKTEAVDVSKIPLEDAIVIGNPSAENKVIVFDDPDCPYCSKLHTEIKKVISQRKDIVFYIKLFPLVSLHPDAYNKSKTIVCEKSLKLLDDAFAGKKIPAPECETTQIDENIQLAASLGISSTPTIILKNGAVIRGYVDADEFIRLIEGAE